MATLLMGAAQRSSDIVVIITTRFDSYVIVPRTISPDVKRPESESPFNAKVRN